MCVSDDGKTSFTANCPQFCEGIAMQNAYSRVVCVRIQVVVEDRFLHLHAALVVETEQEDTSFVMSFTAAVELFNDAAPQPSRAADTVVRRRQDPYSRSN
jgi:hypothetical protein